jgi:hypothetical protein
MRTFVSYDAAGTVIEEISVWPGMTLDLFAAERPHNDVALVENSRELRVIPAQTSAST